jgi:hypothetical protein
MWACRHCHLDAGSLQPLAQLCNLERLCFLECSGLTTSCMESFFKTAVQGSGLEVIVDWSCLEEGGLEQLKATYDSLVQARGANNVPTFQLITPIEQETSSSTALQG